MNHREFIIAAAFGLALIAPTNTNAGPTISGPVDPPGAPIIQFDELCPGTLMPGLLGGDPWCWQPGGPSDPPERDKPPVDPPVKPKPPEKPPVQGCSHST